MIQDSIKCFVSAGVFLKSSDTLRASTNGQEDELVSWIISFSYGTINALFTKEQHRGKGYAELVLREAAQQMIDFGMHPFCEVECENTLPKKILEKVGFKEAFVACYLEHMPCKEQTGNK
jgi:predicted GNAT family acetyltransferase